MWKANGRTTDAYPWQKLTWPMARWAKTRGSAHWACIAHLTIEWYWSKFQREIIITLKNSSHLEWRVGLSDTILKGTHPGTIYAKLGSIWPSCFRGEDFFNISQSEKRIHLGSHVCWQNETKCLLVERNEMEKLYRGPYIDAYCQVWFHLAKLFQRRRFKYEKVNARTTDAK